MTVSTPTGFVLTDDDGVRIEYVRLVDLPPERVWEAATDSALLGRWFGTWEGDPAEGSVRLRFTEMPDDAYPQTVTITECAAPNVLAVMLPSPDGPWPVRLELQPRGEGGTLLVLNHRLTEPFDCASVGAGWHYYLDRMLAVAADQPVPEDWDAYYPALAEAYRLPGEAAPSGPGAPGAGEVMGD